MTYEKIYDRQAARFLQDHNLPQPTCVICGTSLAITKKFRNPVSDPRCKLHSNTKVLLSKTDLLNPRGYGLGRVPDKFTPSEVLTLRCSLHGDFTQVASYFINGGRCQKCYSQERAKRVSKQEWIERCQHAHGSRYDYSLSNFTGIGDDVEIICPNHGVFKQNSGVHMRGHGCTLCAAEENKNNLLITTETFIDRARKVHGDKYDYTNTEYSHSRSSVTIGCKQHGDFRQVAYYHINGSGCPTCGAAHAYKSKAEFEIIEFLESLGMKVSHGDRSFGKELDIYIPDAKVAIEYNGVYWHSSNTKDMDRRRSTQHLSKTELCEEHDVQLLQILDIEWEDETKKEIWKSLIKNKLGKTENRIHARKCQISEVPGKIAREFMSNNHLQGSCRSTKNIGLFYMGQLVALGTFGRARFDKRPVTELLRFATLVNFTVVGGFSRVISYYRKTHPGINLISYANRRWSSGKVYRSTGFSMTRTTAPCYYYTDCKNIWHRSVFQKHLLSKKLARFDSELSEVENMYANGFRRIWDCGHLIYEL